MRVRTWVRTLVMICLCGAVCGIGCKMKGSSIKQHSKTNAAKNKESKETTQEQSKETEDIFNEFYSEDSGSVKSAESKAVLDQHSPSVQEPSAIPVPKKKIQQPYTQEIESPKVSQSSPISIKGAFVVQVICVPSEKMANRYKNKLQKEGFSAYIAEVDNPTAELLGRYYRVRVNGFNTFDEAKEFAETNLVPSGYSYWVDRRSNDSAGTEADAGSPQSHSLPQKAMTESNPSSGSEPFQKESVLPPQQTNFSNENNPSNTEETQSVTTDSKSKLSTDSTTNW